MRELNLRLKYNLYLFGNQPVLVWNTTTIPYKSVAMLNFGGAITVMYEIAGYVYGLVIYADGSRLRQRAQIGGQWITEFASAGFDVQHRMGHTLGAAAADNFPESDAAAGGDTTDTNSETAVEIVAHASRRAARVLSVADPSGYITEYSQALDVVIMFDPYFFEISAFLPNGSTIVLSAAQHHVPIPQTISFSLNNPNTLLVTGTSVSSGFIVAQFFVTTSAFQLTNIYTAENTDSSINSATGEPWCNISTCRIVSRCLDMTINLNAQVCIVHHPDGMLPLVVDTVAGAASFAPDPFFYSNSNASSNYTVDYIAADSILGDMYVAFHYDTSPSVIVGFSQSSLVASYLNQLSTTLLGDPQRVVGIEVASLDRLLSVTIVLATSSTVEVQYLNLFDVISVTPDIVDSDGSAPVVLTGYGFEGNLLNKSVMCVFSEMNATAGRSIQAPAVVLNSTIITCAIPSAVTLLACVPVAVNVLFGTDRITAREDVLISRPSSAEVNVVTTSSGDVGYFIRDAATTLVLQGFGFVPSPYAHCKLVNQTLLSNGTLQKSTVVVVPATFVSLVHAECAFPATISLATTPLSYITYSHDNVTFGAIVGAFSIVSPQHGVHVYNTTTVYPPLVAQYPTRIPTTYIYAVDVQGNAIRRFEASGTLYGLLQPVSANATLATTTGVLQEFLVAGTPYVSASMTNGVAIISGATLRCPASGLYTFTVADVPFRYMQFSWNVTILVGNPVYIRVVDEAYYLSVWRVPAAEYRALNPGLLAFCADVCGNLVTDLDAIPAALQVKYLVDMPEIDPATGEETSNVAYSVAQVAFARVGVDGTYYFDPLMMRSAYGTTVALTFSSPVGIVDSYTTSPLQTENCQIGQEYAVKNTFLCLPCPLRATCDGSIVITQDPGFWRSDVTSAVLYDCSPPYGSDACLTNGNCLAGYEGPRCSTCQMGYGATGVECKQCSDMTLAWIFTALLIFALIAFVVAISIVTLQPHDTADGDLLYEPHPVLNILRNTIAWIHVTGVIFLVVLGVHGVPSFVEHFLLWFAQVSFIELRISYLSCTLASNEFARFRLAVAAPVAIATAAALILSIRLAWLREHRYDVTQTLLSKSGSVRRLSFSSIRKKVFKLAKGEKGIPTKMLDDVKKTMTAEKKIKKTTGNNIEVSSSSDGSVASGEGVHPAERAAYLTDLFDDDVPVLPPTHPVYHSSQLGGSTRARSASAAFDYFEEGTAAKTLTEDGEPDAAALFSARKSQVSFRIPNGKNPLTGPPAATSMRSSFRRQNRQTPQVEQQPPSGNTSSFYAASSLRQHESFRSQNDVDVLVVFDDEEPIHEEAVAAVQEAGARARALRNSVVQGPYRTFQLPDNSSQEESDYTTHERDEWYDNDSQDLLDDLLEEPEDDEEDVYDYNALMLGGSAVQGAAQPPQTQSHHQMITHLERSQHAAPKPPRVSRRRLDELTRQDEEAFEPFDISAAASPPAMVDEHTAPRHRAVMVDAVPVAHGSSCVQRRLFVADGNNAASTPGYLPADDDDDGGSEAWSSTNGGAHTDYFETDSGIYFVTRDPDPPVDAQPIATHGGRNPFLPPSAVAADGTVNAVPFNPFAGRPRPFSNDVTTDSDGDDTGPARNPFNPWDHRKPEADFPSPKGDTATYPKLDPLHASFPNNGVEGGIEDPFWYSFAKKETNAAKGVGKKGGSAWRGKVAKAAVDSKFVAEDGEDLFDLGLPLRHRLLNVWIVAFSVTLYLLFPAVLSACIRIFFCESIEVSPGYYRQVLETDRTIMCSSWLYKQYHTAAVVLIIVYALALPTLIVVSDQFLKRVHRFDDAARWLLAFVCGGLSDSRWRIGSLMHPILMICLICAAAMPQESYERRVSVAIVGAAAFAIFAVYSVQSGVFPRVLEMSRSSGFFVVATLVMMMGVNNNESWISVAGYICVILLLGIAATYVLVWSAQAFQELMQWSETVRDWVSQYTATLEARSFAKVCNKAVELRDSLPSAHQRTANIVGVLYPAHEAMMEALKYHAHLEKQLAEKTALLDGQVKDLEEEEQLFGGAGATSGFFGNSAVFGAQQSSGAYTPPTSEGGNVETSSFASKSSFASTTRSEGLLAVEATALRMTAALAVPAMKRRLEELRVAISALQAVMTRYKRMVSYSLHLFEYYLERMSKRELTLYEGRLTNMSATSAAGVAAYSQHRRATTVDFSTVGAHTDQPAATAAVEDADDFITSVEAPSRPVVAVDDVAQNPSNQHSESHEFSKLSQEEEDAFMMQCTLLEVFSSEKVVITATTQLRKVLRRLTNDAYMGAAVPTSSTRDLMKATKRSSSKQKPDRRSMRRGSASRVPMMSFRDSMMAMSLKKTRSQEVDQDSVAGGSFTSRQ
jgi:hypothetical protein